MSEDLILTGRPEELKPAIMQILATAQLIRDLEFNIPEREVYPERSNKPKVKLYFSQDAKELYKTPNIPPLHGEISYRMMNKNMNTITEADLKTLAQRIKSAFATPPFAWKKGKHMLTYADWDKGIALNVLCYDQKEGKKVVEQLLDLQGKSPDWEMACFKQNLEPSKRYKKQKLTVLGQVIELPEKRRIATVKFRYAEIYIPGVKQNRCLVDITGRKPDPIITVDAKNRTS